MVRGRYYYPRLAGLVSALGCVSVLAGGVTLLSWWDAGWEVGFEAAVYTIPALLMLLLGWLLVVKVERNAYGWVWIAIGWSLSALALLQAYATFALMVQPLPLGWPAATLAGAGWIVSFAMLPLVLLLFPTGKPPTPRWRFVLWVTGAIVLLSPGMAWSMGGEGMVPVSNPQRPESMLAELLRLVTSLMGVVLFILVVLAAISLIYRYRRANATVRQQLKWFVFGGALMAVLLGSDLVYVADLPGLWEPFKEALSLSLLPTAVGIAVFRYRLYDIDRIIRRTLVYSILTTLLALLYFGGILLFEQLVRPLAGNRSSLAIVLSTLLSAALFTPLRRYLQSAIDRHFYRSKYDADHRLAEFGRTARDEVELERLTAEMIRLASQTLQPSSISVWLTEPARTESTGE